MTMRSDNKDHSQTDDLWAELSLLAVVTLTAHGTKRRRQHVCAMSALRGDSVAKVFLHW